MRSVLCVLLLVACGTKEPTVDELIAKHKAAIEPKLAAIEKIRSAPLPEPTGTMKVEGPPLRFIYKDPLSNVGYAYAADLKDLTHYQPNPLRYNFMAEIVNDCVMTIREKKNAGCPDRNADPMPIMADVAKDLLERCAAMRYLIVIDMTAFKDTKYIDKEHFAGGLASANAHLFDLETGKYGGGVSFETQSSSYTSDPDSDLRTKFHEVMRAAIWEQLPDAKL